jgi:hypothetical protein
MRCEKCGSEIRDGVRFCPKCGAPAGAPHRQEDPFSGNSYGWQDPCWQENVPARRETPGRKAGSRIPVLVTGIIAAVLAAVLVLQNFFGLPLLGEMTGGGKKSADVGYSSPEELIREFGEAIAANDVDRALSLFALDHMADSFDLEAYVEYTRAWLPQSNIGLPSEERIFRETNREYLRGTCAWQIALMCFSLQADEEYLQMTPVIADEETDPEEIYSALEDAADLEYLSSFRVLRVDYARPDYQGASATSRESIERQADIYGAEDLAQYAVLYEYDGDTYVGGVGVIRYDGKYYIQYLNGSYLGLSSFGFLLQADEGEYLDIVENGVE